jgi:hypothetical protein
MVISSPVLMGVRGAPARANDDPAVNKGILLGFYSRFKLVGQMPNFFLVGRWYMHCFSIIGAWHTLVSTISSHQSYSFCSTDYWNNGPEESITP